MMRSNQREQRNEIVGTWDSDAKFHQQRFQILLSSLLAVETDEIMQRNAAACESSGGEKVGLGLADPFGRQPLHTAPFPET
jgi:hypothetical protein